MTYDMRSFPPISAVIEEAEQKPSKRCNIVCRDIDNARKLIALWRIDLHNSELYKTYYIERRGNMITLGRWSA